MNILLTGSGGFIGRNLLEQLGTKYHFIAPRSAQLNLLDKSAVDRFFTQHPIDFIIHCAAAGARITDTATRETVATPNVAMFTHLAAHTGPHCRMITFGSGAEYDKSRPLVNVREEEFGRFIPQDPYGYSKYQISQLILRQDYILNLRAFGVYGKYEHPSRMISYAIFQTLRQKSILLNQDVIFDYVYIDDVCRLVDIFITHPTEQKFINITSGNKIHIANLAQQVNKLARTPSKILIKQPGLGKEYTGDNSLLKKILPTFTFTPYEKALPAFYKILQQEYNL